MNFLELCLCGMSKAQLAGMGKGYIEKRLVHREVGLGTLYLQCVSGSVFERDLQRMGFPGGSMVKNLPAKQETGSIPGVGRSPREGNGNPLQYSSLGNPMDRGAWGATVHGVITVRCDLATKP